MNWKMIVVFFIFMTSTELCQGKRKRCDSISIKYARVVYKKRNRVAKVMCFKGYKLIDGDQYMTCQTGRWSGRLPKCISRGCNIRFSVSHGVVDFFYKKALAMISCDPGYELEGSSAISCDGTNWNATIPTCTASIVHVTHLCDFETDDICGWSNFDWQRNTGALTGHIGGTGIRTDHTYGTRDGHVMYFESKSEGVSWFPDSLYSPQFKIDHSSSNRTCFVFYYYAYNVPSGNPSVSLAVEDDLQVLYTNNEGRGDQWVLGYTEIPQNLDLYQIVISVTRSASYSYEVAVDDVEIATDETCEEYYKAYSKQEAGNDTSSTTDWGSSSTNSLMFLFSDNSTESSPHNSSVVEVSSTPISEEPDYNTTVWSKGTKYSTSSQDFSSSPSFIWTNSSSDQTKQRLYETSSSTVSSSSSPYYKESTTDMITRYWTPTYNRLTSSVRGFTTYFKTTDPQIYKSTTDQNYKTSTGNNYITASPKENESYSSEDSKIEVSSTTLVYPDVDTENAKTSYFSSVSSFLQSSTSTKSVFTIPTNPTIKLITPDFYATSSTLKRITLTSSEPTTSIYSRTTSQRSEKTTKSDLVKNATTTEVILVAANPVLHNSSNTSFLRRNLIKIFIGVSSGIFLCVVLSIIVFIYIKNKKPPSSNGFEEDSEVQYFANTDDDTTSQLILKFNEDHNHESPSVRSTDNNTKPIGSPSSRVMPYTLTSPSSAVLLNRDRAGTPV